MKTKAFTWMRNDTENKKAARIRFIGTGWRGFLFFAEMAGLPAASTDFWTLKNGKIYMEDMEDKWRTIFFVTNGRNFNRYNRII